MTENDRVFDAFRNCITEPKCKDCPLTECDTLKNRVVEIPIDLALAVMRMLEAQEPVIPKKIQNTVGFWCECGFFLGLRGGVKYCAMCRRAVKWE